MSYQELSQLIELANLSRGRARQIAVELFEKAIERADWKAQHMHLLDPLKAAFDTMPEGEVASQVYKILFTEANDEIFQLRAKEKEWERLQTLEGAVDAALKIIEQQKSIEDLVRLFSKLKESGLGDRLTALAEKVQARDESGLPAILKLAEKLHGKSAPAVPPNNS